MYNSHPPPITYCSLLCHDDHEDAVDGSMDGWMDDVHGDDVDNDRNCDSDEDVLMDISVPN